MNLPPVFYSLKFWQSVSVILAAVAYQLGWVNGPTDAVILAAVLAVLNLFGVVPELRARGLMK